MGLKETLLAYKPKIEPVENRTDEGVYVRVMTGAGRYTLERKFQDLDKNNALVETVIVCACDAEGVLIFNDSDKAQLNQMPSDMLQDIFAAAMKVNKMTGEEIEADTKLSEKTTSEDSGTS